MKERIEVTYAGAVHEVAYGARVEELLRRVDGGVDDDVLGALVNRRQVMLDFPLRGRATVELIRFGSRQGEAIYKRSACLLLYEACRRVAPELSLILGQSFGNAYHFQVQEAGDRDVEALAEELEAEMVSLRDQRLPISRRTVPIEEAEDLFRAARRPAPLELLSTRRSSAVHLISCGDHLEIAHGPYAPFTDCLKTFAVTRWNGGLLLRFPRRADRASLPGLRPRPRLAEVFVEHRRWQDVLEIHHVGQLNRRCLDGSVSELIQIAEGFQEKKIAQIADAIAAAAGRVRLVTIAGPSSSGKTTFLKRLGLQLRINGLEPVSLSLDDYYVNRDATPRDEEGELDFESIEAIDLPLLRHHLQALLAGDEVLTPTFDFQSGLRRPEDRWHPLRLEKGQVLVIEGIHGLNPRLIEGIDHGWIFRIFVSALAQLAIDDHHRIFTADARLIRRIVRDRFFRGFNAERTLSLWGRVRRGEKRWIDPFQEEADVMFNSALIYESAVLTTYAERFLLEVPRTSPVYPEAYRLLKFLLLFVPVFPDEVPDTSILREFIGGSAFRY